MARTKHERERPLADPHIAALSVHAGDGRGPAAVPIWYQHAPGGQPRTLTAAGSLKAQLIEAARRYLTPERAAEYLRPQHRVPAHLGAV